MKASIIIPTYNASASLERLLKSLAAIADSSLAEVLVCDDGSTDNTGEMVCGFTSQLPVRYLHHDDRGFRAAAARNLGIRDASGDITIFVDSDVVLPVGFLRAHLRRHDDSFGNRLVIGYRRRVTVAPPPNTELAQVQEYEPDHREAIPFPESVADAPWYFAYSCNMSVSGSLRRLMFAEEFVGWGNEDIEFAYRAVTSGAEIIFAKDATLWHVDEGACRDPFRRDPREANFTSFVINTVRMLLKHDSDQTLRALLEADLVGFRLDGNRCVRDPSANDPGAIRDWAAKQIRISDAESVTANALRNGVFL